MAFLTPLPSARFQTRTGTDEHLLGQTYLGSCQAGGEGLSLSAPEVAPLAAGIRGHLAPGPRGSTE